MECDVRWGWRASLANEFLANEFLANEFLGPGVWGTVWEGGGAAGWRGYGVTVGIGTLSPSVMSLMRHSPFSFTRRSVCTCAVSRVRRTTITVTVAVVSLFLVSAMIQRSMMPSSVS